MTGEMRFIARNIRGSASIFVLVSCIVLLIVSALVFDVARLYAVKVNVRHGLNLALRAAVAQLDMDALADPHDPRLVINPAQAEEKFYQVLQTNLKLDTNNVPLPGSIADGPVEVCFFKVVNQEELPFERSFSYHFGEYQVRVEKVGATAIIKVPVKLGSFARAAVEAPELTDVYVHSTVVPEVVPQS